MSVAIASTLSSHLTRHVTCWYGAGSLNHTPQGGSQGRFTAMGNFENIDTLIRQWQKPTLETNKHVVQEKLSFRRNSYSIHDYDLCFVIYFSNFIPFILFFHFFQVRLATFLDFLSRLLSAV